MRKLLILTLGLSVCSIAMSKKIEYPTPPSDPTVTDEYFGIVVADPYRPLENDTSAATLAWGAAENAVTEAYMSQIPFRNTLREQLEQFNNYPKPGIPWKEKDGWYYFYKNDGLQNQAVLYRTKDLNGEAEIFLDPNTLSSNGTVALKSVRFSRDGKYAAYAISRNGSDWEEIYVMDSNTKELLPDHVEWSKFGGVNWKGDGFYYSSYPRPEEGKEFSNANENHRVYYHKLGDSQNQDTLIYEDLDHPLYFHSVEPNEDETVLFLFTGGNGSGNGLKVKDLTKDDAPWITIQESQDYEVTPIDVIDGKIYLYTSKDAPKNRIVTAALSSPQPENWVELIPESDAVLSGVIPADGKMILVYDRDASQHAYIYNMDGTEIREIIFPTFGTVAFNADRDEPEVFYRFSSFAYPGTIYSYNMNSGESTAIWQSAPRGFNPTDYETEQVFYTSKDGTKVPMYIVYKKGIERDGNNPTYLYGYGGFNVPLYPGFSAMRLGWLENGGVYAMANLRGGSEYGEEWHQAGTKMQKQNVFDDFIAAAEYLIDNKWTNPDKLAIEGASNGGLLIGAVVNQRPELFKVAVPRVGVMDMMRYHLFTIGWNWAPDYGTSADSPEMAQYLLNYSPAHNIRNGVNYPAILVMTADHDDRVVPAHSFKYAAALQAADTGDNPKLIRIESNAGHGGGKPISKVINEYADIYSFIFYNLGVNPEKK